MHLIYGICFLEQLVVFAQLVIRFYAVRLNALFLLFETDGSISEKGFKANYSFIDASCGGIIKKEGVAINPRKYNTNQYEDNSNCKWVIIAPLHYMVQISFTSFALEDSDTCYYDYVEVIDGFENSGTSIGKYVCESFA